MKRVLFFALAIASVHLVYGQSSISNNSLLWRISGNGLQRPSYLFGTMHLSDKRVFQLGDSLYRAIEQAEGFAAELNLARVGMEMVNQVIAEKEAKAASEPVKVKDVVPPETWEKYKDHLRGKFYKPAEDITVDDLDQVEEALQSDLIRKGDMPTFLDAYLFGIARKQGKWVGGIEELRDQVEHMRSVDIESKIQTALFDDEYYRSGIEGLVNIYRRELMDSIDRFMYRSQDGKKDYIMIKRNLKMARVMDSLALVRSTVFAVGAAHLPGDSGVISLLRQKGFTVTPVISSKKISANKYVVKSVRESWEPVGIKDSLYSVDMPGYAESVASLAEMGLDIKMFYDLTQMKLYMTMGLPLSAERKALGEDSLFLVMKSRFSERSGSLKERSLTLKGFRGKEFSGSSADGELKIQVFLPAMEAIVVNAVYAFQKKVLNDEETLKFFNSFSYHGVKETSRKPEEWSGQVFREQLFRVEAPVKLRETRDQTTEGLIDYLYQSFDLKKQMHFFIKVSKAKEGRFHSSIDSNHFLASKDYIRNNLVDATVLDSSFTADYPYPAFRFEVSGTSQLELLKIKVLMIARGSRIYTVYTAYSPQSESESAARRFMQSFALLPYEKGNWKRTTAPDSSFSIFSPATMKETIPEAGTAHSDGLRYIIYDSTASATIFLDKSIIPGWCWFESDTAFLRKRSKDYCSYSDSVADYRQSYEDGQTTVDFFVRSKNSFLVKRVKLILVGDQLYEAYSFLDPYELNTIYSPFFEQITVNPAPLAGRRQRGRMAELQTILDTATLADMERVSNWWSSVEFSLSDIPLLQSLLLKIYPDFDTSYQSGINHAIFTTIQRLDTLNATVAYLNDHYKNIRSEDEYIKPFVVDYLSGIKTAESYRLLKDVLVNQPMEINYSSMSNYYLYDSLELTATLFPELLKKADSKVLAYYVQSIAAHLLDSGYLDKAAINRYSQPILSFAREKLVNDASLEENAYQYYDCVRLLGAINTTQSYSVLNKFAKFSNRGLRFHTCLALLGNGQPVDSRTLYTLATTDEYRFRLYEGLRKIGRLKLFPREFLTQRELGKSKIYEFSDEEPFFPISGIGDRVAMFKGEKKRFCLYKASYPDGEAYLAVAGPFDLNQKNVESSHEATGVFWESEFDSSEVESHFRQFLDAIEHPEDSD